MIVIALIPEIGRISEYAPPEEVSRRVKEITITAIGIYDEIERRISQ